MIRARSVRPKEVMRICGLNVICGVLAVAVASSVHAQMPDPVWSQRFGSTGLDQGLSVTVNSTNDIYVTGGFSGTVNLGGSPLVSAGGTDIFLARYNADGVHQWSVRFGSTGNDRGNAVALGLGDDVYLTGYFSGTVNFGGPVLTSAGGADIFVATFTSAGSTLWSSGAGGTGTDEGRAVQALSGSEAIVTGYFNGSMSFLGGPLLTSAGAEDIFIAKLDFNGFPVWSQRYGSTLGDFGNDIVVYADNQAIVTGSFQGSVNFGTTLVSAGGSDVFITKYFLSNPNPILTWGQRFGSTGDDRGNAVAVSTAGDILATGSFNGNVVFGGGSLTSAGGDDIFLAKYNSGGTHQWSKRFGGAGSDISRDVAVDLPNNLLLTGSFQGTVNFGSVPFVSAGGNDIFVAKYDASGIQQWSQRFGNTGGDVGYGVGVTTSGDAVFAGEFAGTVNFGDGALASAGNSDFYLARYGAFATRPKILSITDAGNDQGRRARISIVRSGYDFSGVGVPVIRYEAYRRNGPLAANPTASTFLSSQQLLDLGWVYAGAVPANAVPAYLMDAPTDADSTISLGQHYSSFFVRAATAQPSVYYDSPIDSGYSVDNLAPGVPMNLVYNASQLSWTESTALDFDYFTVYGSASAIFNGSAVLVNYTTTTGMDVTASPYVFYYVTATDFSGNEGKAARVNTLSGVGGTPKSYVLSVSNYPNPFNPSTTVSYTVPARGAVTVAIYDASGARIATLVDGEVRDAGAYSVEWKGRADSGGVASSGVYFARVEHNGAVRSRKLLLLK